MSSKLILRSGLGGTSHLQSGALQLSQQDDSSVINKGDSQAILKQFKKLFTSIY